MTGGSMSRPIEKVAGARVGSLHLHERTERLKQVLRDAGDGWLRRAKYLLPDHVFLALSHRRKIGRFPRFRNPETFNELILARCLHPNPRWSRLADKLAVRDYVRDRIGEKYLIPLIAAPDVFTQEIFNSLPASFVMKANHGSAFVEIVWDKSKRSFDELRAIADRWLHTDYYRQGRERHYRAIKPRILFETLLLDSSGKIPPDFKMNMFGNSSDGPIIYTGVVQDRFGNERIDLYDAQWRTLDLELGDFSGSGVPPPPPPNWEEVIRVATRLMEGLGYVRVDLYVFDDKIYFGELTFTPGGGIFPFSPDRYDYEWGRLFKAMT
ncbi:ATP-grasp fold amidoligase family protein [Trinickia sp. EG282A]|uniref:ATP-grasp fold amidoligase family protein n=1 Tax=Trinickia sp. EG282A TaxID=3237013 RepID=UPI0034D376A4